MHGVGAPDGFRPGFGETDVAYVAGLHQVGDRADGLLDRDSGVDASEPVDVDVVGAEPRERVGEEGLDGRGSAVDADPAPGGVAQGAELDADRDLIAVAIAQRLAYQQFVVAHAVVVAAVEQGDPGVEGCPDGGDALRFVGGAVEVGHAHAAQSKRGDAGTGGAERASDHEPSSRVDREATSREVPAMLVISRRRLPDDLDVEVAGL